MRYQPIRRYPHDRFSLGRDSLTGEPVFAIAVPLHVGHYTAYYRISEEELGDFLADEEQLLSFAARVEHCELEIRHMTAALSMDTPEGGVNTGPAVTADGLPRLSLKIESMLHLSKSPPYSISRDARTDEPLFEIPVSNRMVDYEEYYRINEAELELLLAHPSIAAAFAECCGRRRMDDRLVLKPGTDRGYYSR
jgi:hypothetical protein